MCEIEEEVDVRLTYDPVELLKERLSPVLPAGFGSEYEWKISWEARARAAIRNDKTKKETA